MKRAITALGLLLILAAASVGFPDSVYAGLAPQGYVIQTEQSSSSDSDNLISDDCVQMYGDPDDAITGNRNNGVTDNGSPFGAFSSTGDDDDVQPDDWLAWLMMMLCRGLI